MSAPVEAAKFPEIKVPAGLTFAGLVLGFALGVLLQGTPALAALMEFAEPAGKLWLRALQLTILPLVVGLVYTGISQTLAAAGGGRLARRAVGLFFICLLAAGTMSALLIPALLELFPIPERAIAALSGGAAEAGKVPGFSEILLAMMPENIFAAAAAGAMLPIVLFVSVLAVAATRIADAPRRHLATLFEGLAAAMMVVIGWVLAIAPIGVFGLSLAVAANSGTDAIGALAHYILVVSAAGLVVMLAGYGIALVLARKGLGQFARAMLPVQAVALSTQSSLACLPAMLGATRKLGVREATADFVLPLAVAIFRGTSPAMNMGVAIYAAYLTGTPLSPFVLAVGVLVAFLVSLSSVSLPGTLSFVISVGPIANAMGVPIAPLALLVAVEILPDLMRTLGNVTMDVAVTAAVDEGRE
ncbi:cation:dicarboxylase symporter family transporter [Novosphingobium sp.]|uniref:dicarboxylate/amino acid:cation symporter n=1 Tax=Novosphingobium sp. TaxID=1874826 RepID=UPI0025DA6FF7|nr:cation:dicarboxylase symporter family transporter [Novosphingobium sp.]MCC6926170.1 cation:dicarboxylase symporter family transporter [Novosphingobium sp.]